MLRQFHRSLLPRIKFNRNFPFTIISIDLALGGLGLRTLELEQGLKSISHLISLWDSSTPTSNLLRVSLEFLKLEVSKSDLALNKSFSPCGSLATLGWLTSVWELLDAYQLSITIPSLTIPNPSFTNEITITDLAVSVKSFNKQ